MSGTSLVAKQFRLQQWADDIRSCMQRPEGLTVKQWCAEHGINKATYYWRLRAVRKACLDIVGDDVAMASEQSGENPLNDFVELRPIETKRAQCSDVSVILGNATIVLPEDVSDSFLLRVMEAAYHVK